MKHKTEGTQRKTSPPNRCRLRPYCIPTPLTPQPPRRKADQIGRNLFERHHGSRNGLYDLKSMHPSLSLSVQFEKKDTTKKTILKKKVTIKKSNLKKKNAVCEKMEKKVYLSGVSRFLRDIFSGRKSFLSFYSSRCSALCAIKF